MREIANIDTLRVLGEGGDLGSVVEPWKLMCLPSAAAEVGATEMGVWASAGGQNGESIRQPRDRLTGQPQERQHSACVARS